MLDKKYGLGQTALHHATEKGNHLLAQAHLGKGVAIDAQTVVARSVRFQTEISVRSDRNMHPPKAINRCTRLRLT